MFCPKCGKEVVFVCETCGKVIKRPKSINAAAIISLITSILSVLIGVFFTFLHEYAKKMVTSTPTPSEAFLLKWGTLVGIAMIIWGIVDFIVWFGLRRLRKWAGFLCIGAAALAIILSIFLAQLRDVVSYVINLILIILVSKGWKALR